MFFGEKHTQKRVTPCCSQTFSHIWCSLENNEFYWKYNCHMTQQSHCWVYTPIKPELKETHIPQCTHQHYLHNSSDMEELKHPLVDEWIRKLWYKKKPSHLGQFLMRSMKLEPIIQSEVSQKEKHQCSILMHIYGI